MSWSPQKVVVPMDFSDESLRAVDYGLDLAPDASRLSVIHVLPDVIDWEAGLLLSGITDESRIELALVNLRERLADPRYKPINLAASIGDPGSEIVDFAEASGADLIVIPSHGRRGVRRLLLGSVAERVVRLAHCPVLVLKPGLTRS